MPTILPRTKETEKAQKYSVPDLIIELAKKVVQDTRKGIKKKTGEKLTDKALTDLALAPQAGMLKPYGVGKMIGGAIKSARLHPSFTPHTPKGVIEARNNSDARAILELLRVPQSEWGRIRNIFWGFNPGLAGRYVQPPHRLIELMRGKATKGTPWHEFIHGRTYKPAKDLGEVRNAMFLREASRFLRKEYGKDFVLPFYYVDPIETMAHAGTNAMIRLKPNVRLSMFNKVYAQTLSRQVKHYNKTLRELYSPKIVDKLWTNAERLSGKMK